MGGLDAAAHQADDKKKKSGPLSHKKKRVGISIDMTPFVDIAFLLLIFFMVTTVFRLPQAMELTLPPKDAEQEVAESNVIILYVYNDGEMQFRIGNDGPLEPIAMGGLVETLNDLLKQNEKLITMVKFERKTPFHWMVDVVDEFTNVGKITRYSFDQMTPEEVAEVKGGA
jgi:biopolymer transport protein ExbD